MAKTKYKEIAKNTFMGFRIFLSSLEMLVVFLVLFSGVYLWNNPTYLQKFFPTETHTIKEVKYAIPESINQSIDNLSAEISEIQDKNKHFLNIKADSSVVLSLVEKVNAIENKLQKFSQTSNEGALLLTSAMMIKEEISQGNSFVFEAQMLKTLSYNEPDISIDVEYIYKNSEKRFPSDKIIVDDFSKLYSKLVSKHTPPVETDWKKRIKQKVDEYVKVNQQLDNVEENTVLNELDAIKQLVDNYEFSKVFEIVHASTNNLKDEDGISEWMELIQTKQTVLKALQKIASQSLVIMKVQNLK